MTADSLYLKIPLIRLRSQELENKMGLNEEELEEKTILKNFLSDVERLMKEQMF